MLCNLPISKYITIRIWVLGWGLLCSTGLFAQNKNNYLQANTYNTTFNLPVNALNTQQVISNAFRLATVSKSKNYFNIYARVYSSTGPNGTGLPASLFSIRLNTVTPNVIIGNYSTMQLSNTDMLIQQIVTVWPFWNNYSEVDFNYDLLLAPLGYSYQSGTYVTTFLFTLTQP